MVRPRSKSREALISTAMWTFWTKGYAGTSIGDLVDATGVGRGGIYTDFGGKEDLYLQTLKAYREKFVDPALKLLDEDEDEDEDEDDDGLSGIEAYFDHFIGLHRKHGMPGPGCFLANAMTELAPHDDAVQDLVEQHGHDLRRAFRKALSNAARKHGARLSDEENARLAAFLATASQGLWSQGRSIHEIEELVRFKKTLLDLLDRYMKD